MGLVLKMKPGDSFLVDNSILVTYRGKQGNCAEVVVNAPREKRIERIPNQKIRDDDKKNEV